MNYALRTHGLPTHPAASYPAFIGEGARCLVQRAVPPSAADRVDELLAAFQERYSAYLVVHTRAFPGVESVLATLAQRGVPLAVLSNKPHPMTVGVVQALFGNIPFVDVLGQREGFPRKPDPTVACELAKQMGVEPSRCALVGDTRIDVQTGTAAGMLVLGVLWGCGGEEELRRSGAQALIERPEDLLPLHRP